VLKAAVACSIQSVIYRMPSVHSNLRPLAETPTMIKARNGIRRKAPPNPRPHEFSPPNSLPRSCVYSTVTDLAKFPE